LLAVDGGHDTMPTNRTPINRTPRRLITTEMIELFKRGHAIRIARDDLYWEPEGKRAEYIEVSCALHRLLGRRPGQLGVLEAGPKPLEDDARILADWQRARTLRRQLIQAARNG